MGRGGLLDEGSPLAVSGAVHLDADVDGSWGLLRCRSGMASRIGRRSTGHRGIFLGTTFSEVNFYLVLFLAELFLSTCLLAVSLASASSSSLALAFSLTAFSALFSA
jgi:hypothetical protein